MENENKDQRHGQMFRQTNYVDLDLESRWDGEIKEKTFNSGVSLTFSCRAAKLDNNVEFSIRFQIDLKPDTIIKN